MAVSYSATEWTTSDDALFGAKIGSPGSQATWEAFALLLALRQWADGPQRGPVRILGDALGMLAGMTKFSAKSQVVNAIAREAALILAPLGRELASMHIWSEENGLADALSR
eukprot:15800043-Heterocapsa_arctica.AAC.1